jgi:hypothetical protein
MAVPCVLFVVGSSRRRAVTSSSSRSRPHGAVLSLSRSVVIVAQSSLSRSHQSSSMAVAPAPSSPSFRRAIVIVAPSSCCRAVRVAPSRPPSCTALPRRRHNRGVTPSCLLAVQYGCTFVSHTEAPSCRRAVVAMSRLFHRRAVILSRCKVVVPLRRPNFAVTLSLHQSRSVALHRQRRAFRVSPSRSE